MKPILVVQHAELEGPAELSATLQRAKCNVTVIRTDLGQLLPSDLADYVGLIVMGGPMSATSDDNFPSRRAELALLRIALAESMPTLGVCLGAQLLAAAAGAEVYLGEEPEIGWRPVMFTAAAGADPLLSDLESPLTVLHWHGETFDLPSDAVHLAESSLYTNQAFRLGSAAWGLQFHIEVDEAAVERFVTAFPDDAARSPGGAASIRADADAAIARLRDVHQRVGTRFAHLAQQLSASR
ncbi:MAG: type 1 glutamine amidotransferase [Acidimicrobiia bacterium]